MKRIKFNKVGIYESETRCEKANLARRNDDHCVADFPGDLESTATEEYSAAHRHSDEQAFRFNELARHLPIAVKAEKTKQKRLSRFVKSKLPIAAMQEKWLTFVLIPILKINGAFCVVAISVA